MRRSLSPILRELENLEKDADSRKLAMKALKSYVKDLDSKAIPMFLAKVSESKETGVSSGEYTISLYDVLARVHGPKIVPQIDNIMITVVKTLSSSAGSFALHQACSKVVPAIARYAIDPTTADDKKRYIIHSLCKPLSDCLLGSLENLSSGAALCLQMLVQSDNWRFASNEMVNEVCQRVAAALEKHSQTNSHMALVMTLAKHNSLIVEAYSRLFLQSGLQILDVGFAEENSQKQLSAIHMMSCLMRCLDPKSISSELEFVIKELEKCQSDRMPFVTGAAFEAVQIAKRTCAEKGLKFERVIDSITGSNSDGRENTRSARVKSPRTASPESQTINSFVGYDYFTGSPISMKQDPRGTSDYRRSVNRKLWRRCKNGVLDISLKDGIFSSITREVDILKPDSDEFSDSCSGHTENFAGFLQGTTGRAAVRSTMSSPQRSNSTIKLNDVKIFSTPRKLIRSLQDPDNLNLGFSKNQTGRVRNSTPITFDQMTASNFNGLSPGINPTVNSDENLSYSGEQFICSSESVSSTEDVYPDTDTPVSVNMIPINETQIQDADVHKVFQLSARKIGCGIFLILFAVVYRLLAIDDLADGNILVPT
ncbi:protein SINE1-like [Primulina huaijiensis]|uniref:protein SINE1-like n=1 Tax=Primulina huaijiensis TaxID=1492673 RepID=UPI003CC6E8D8